AGALQHPHPQDEGLAFDPDRRPVPSRGPEPLPGAHRSRPPSRARCCSRARCRFQAGSAILALSSVSLSLSSSSAGRWPHPGRGRLRRPTATHDGLLLLGLLQVDRRQPRLVAPLPLLTLRPQGLGELPARADLHRDPAAIPAVLPEHPVPHVERADPLALLRSAALEAVLHGLPELVDPPLPGLDLFPHPLQRGIHRALAGRGPVLLALRRHRAGGAPRLRRDPRAPPVHVHQAVAVAAVVTSTPALDDLHPGGPPAGEPGDPPLEATPHLPHVSRSFHSSWRARLVFGAHRSTPGRTATPDRRTCRGSGSQSAPVPGPTCHRRRLAARSACSATRSRAGPGTELASHLKALNGAGRLMCFYDPADEPARRGARQLWHFSRATGLSAPASTLRTETISEPGCSRSTLSFASSSV